MLAQNYPERLVDEFEFHLLNQNWQYIEDILEIIVKQFNLNTSSEYALLKCLSSYEALNNLKTRAVKEKSLRLYYEAQISYLGGVHDILIFHMPILRNRNSIKKLYVLI